MEDKEFREQYKKEFDSVCASDELRNAVMNLKPQKPRRVLTPFKATIGTVAAAIMIFAAVHDYNFKTDTSGVISEKVVSTPLPYAQFEIVEKKKPTSESTDANDTPNSAPTQGPKSASETTVTPTQAPAATKAPQSTAKPVEAQPTAVMSEPTSEAAEATAGEDSGIAPFSAGGPSPRSGGGGYTPPTIEMWSVDRYYEYLGTNVSQKISGRYTGAQSMEFEIGSDGLPLDDIAVLNFATNSGASVRVTVSKHTIFDSALSGTVSEAGGGYNGYKINNGVYYNIFVTNSTYNEVVSIVNSL